MNPLGKLKQGVSDGASVRADFPVFAKNKNLVYLDSASSAQKPQAVIGAMNAVMMDYANVHRGIYGLSQNMTAAYEAARAKVADFIHAGTEEIVFTRNATESINLVAASWGAANLKPGDEILITALEHHANIVPWQLIAEKTGAKLVVAPITDKGDVLAADVIAKMTSRTKMVALSHMSNVLGTILPVTEIVAAAKKAGAATLIDGCQAIVHASVDVKALGCDFYVFSGHKLYGPTGIGVLYGRKEMLNAMPPYQGGGDMIDQVTFEKTTFKNAPARFEAGTPAFVEAIGLAAAIGYLQSLDRIQIVNHEDELYQSAYVRLKAMPGVKIYGEAVNRGSILCFTCDWGHVSDVAMIMDKQGIAVRAGHHCAMPLMKELGVTATIRASIGLYTTMDDIDALLAGLHKAKEMLS